MAGKRKVTAGSGKRPSKKRHLKITRKLMPLIRAERAPTSTDFKEVAAHLQPTRDYRTVRKIYEKYVKGEPWSKSGPAPEPKHEPIRVNMELQKLLAKESDLTLAQCAFRFDIKPSTFYSIYKKVEALPPERTDYSRDNPKFCPDYMFQFQLPRHTLRIEAFSLTDLGGAGAPLGSAETMATFELPLVKKLLAEQKKGAQIRILVPKKRSKLIIVDDVMSSSGSVNPSFQGLNLSYESITYHFMISKSPVKEALFMEIDDEWVSEQEALTTAAKQLAAAQASEGFAPEELVSEELAPKELVLGEFVDEEGGAIIEEEKKERAHKANAADYNRLKLAGICVECRAGALADGENLCIACRHKKQFKYYQRLEEGRCGYCNKKKPASDKHSACAACREKCAAKRSEAIQSRDKYNLCRNRAQESNKRCDAKRAALGIKRQKMPGQCCHCHRPCATKPPKKGGGLYSECDWCRIRVRAKLDFNTTDGIRQKQRPRRPGLCQCGNSAKARDGGGFFSCCEECLEKTCQRGKARYWEKKAAAQREDEEKDEEEKEESAGEYEEKDGVHF
ncbi:hypothetical protein PHYSODRAFT_337476 [Phytophthora sojae]|uniref:Uncharacterized protein n=1 Tax=Phytophthora sojae (strain P6497) TaxID=1094619 RepID=G5A1A2_PHYSP|nr:hypothetical protein PHYSODRAFT_337476 [Phytophthora sojae]EGZ10701.1 hypothetical protein PHYSODRAFT_337476 [Phytophthora sojae]|eukprot:XP_009533446.1 hypothetical protein PHYSODRAFT_337476 [Phytophthora sojae]